MIGKTCLADCDALYCMFMIRLIGIGLAAVWVAAACRAAGPALVIAEAGQQSRPPQPEGLSGLTHAGGTRYYAVDDSGGVLVPLTIHLDVDTGAILSHTNHPGIALGGRDLEGVAYDAARGTVLVCDEADSSIWEFDPAGPRVGEVALPGNLRANRLNLGLESLTLRPDGRELWTCNEEALHQPDRGIDDGPRSNTNAGSVVRLTRLTRADPQHPWRPDGQWAYRTDAIGGVAAHAGACSGVADLCVLPDGTLLVLEREISTKGVFPEFRSRIYQVDRERATDVSAMPSLLGAAFTPVSKKQLFDRNTVLANYEGICLGPRLADGAYSLLMISDGDGFGVELLFALRLFGLETAEANQ